MPRATAICPFDAASQWGGRPVSPTATIENAPGGSERGFGRDGFVFQQTFDFNFTDTFLLPPSQYTAPRFDVLAYIGYIGTSMATPHVTAGAALVRAANANLDRAGVAQKLEGTAAKLPGMKHKKRKDE